MIESVKIGYRTYRVDLAPEGVLEDGGRSAEISYKFRTIRVSDALDGPDRAEATIHEVLHGLLRDTGEDIKRDAEERLVHQLSPRVAAFFRDNPKEVRELVEMLGA